jgi:nitrile hydratase
MCKAKFSIGTRVGVQELAEAEYKRPPVYAVGASGIVDEVRGPYERPAETTESHLYSVRFESTEIWGEDAEHNASVYVDLWEECLEPTSSPADERRAMDQTDD